MSRLRIGTAHHDAVAKASTDLRGLSSVPPANSIETLPDEAGIANLAVAGEVSISLGTYDIPAECRTNTD